ncbi:hypothetical protein CEXT_67231, partial [Caerostris extrusa]
GEEDAMESGKEKRRVANGVFDENVKMRKSELGACAYLLTRRSVRVPVIDR